MLTDQFPRATKPEARFRAIMNNWPGIISVIIGTIGATFAIQAALLVTGVISARILGPEGRGYFALLNLVAATSSRLIVLGVDSAVTYYMAQKEETAPAVARLMYVPAAIQIAVCFLVQSAVIWFITRSAGHSLQTAALLSLAMGPAFIIQSYSLNILRGLHQFRSYNLMKVFAPILYALTLLPLVAFDFGHLTTVTFAWVISYSIAAALVGTLAIRRIARAKTAPTEVSRPSIFSFGIRGFLGTSSPIDDLRLDQAMIALFLTPHALGIYVTALALTNLPKFIANSVGRVALPTIAAKSGIEKRISMVWRFSKYTTIASVPIALALAVAMPLLIPLFFGPDFRDAIVPSQILLVAALFTSIRRTLVEGLRGVGDAGAGSWSELASWITLFPMLWYMAPRWGLFGVAFASIIGSASGLSIVLIIAIGATRKAHGKSWHLTRSRGNA